MRAFLLLIPLILSACVGIYADGKQTSVITPLGVYTEERAPADDDSDSASPY